MEDIFCFFLERFSWTTFGYILKFNLVGKFDILKVRNDLRQLLYEDQTNALEQSNSIKNHDLFLLDESFLSFFPQNFVSFLICQHLQIVKIYATIIPKTTYETLFSLSSSFPQENFADDDSHKIFFFFLWYMFFLSLFKLPSFYLILCAFSYTIFPRYIQVGSWSSARNLFAWKICSTQFYYCSTPFEQ